MTNDATTAKQYDPGALPGLPSGYRPWPALWALWQWRGAHLRRLAPTWAYEPPASEE